MKIRNLILLAFGLLPFFAAAQTATFDRVRVRQGLTIRAEKADSIIRAVTALSNHTSIPTAKAVWDAIAAIVAASKYQTLRDDGSNMTQQPNANFVSTGTVAFALTNDGGNTETEIAAAVPAGGITSTELAASSVNSSKIRDTTIVAGDIKNATITSAKLANSGVAAGTYPSTNALVAQFTVNAQGQITTVTQISAADVSATNEGILGVSANGSNDAGLISNTSTANTVVIAGGTAIGVSESTSSNGGTITITNTGDTDGTNDLTVSDTTRRVLSSSTHFKYPTAAAVYNAIIAGGTARPDSTWAKSPSGTYTGKRITDNIYHAGKAGVGTTDTTAMLNLRPKNPAATVLTTVEKISAPPRSAFSDPIFVGNSNFTAREVDINPMKPNHYPSWSYGIWKEKYTVDSTTNLAVAQPGNAIRQVGFNLDNLEPKLARWYWNTEQLFYPGSGGSSAWEHYLELYDTLGRQERIFQLFGLHNGNNYQVDFAADDWHIRKPHTVSGYVLRIRPATGMWETDYPYTFRINNSTRVGPLMERLHGGSLRNVLDWTTNGRLNLGDAGGIHWDNRMEIGNPNGDIPKIISLSTNLRLDTTYLYVRTDGTRHLRLEKIGASDYFEQAFGGTDFSIGSNTATQFLLHKSAPGNSIRVAASGKVGLGEATPLAQLHIQQPSNALGGGLRLRSNAGLYWENYINSANESVWNYEGTDKVQMGGSYLRTFDAGSVSAYVDGSSKLQMLCSNAYYTGSSWQSIASSLPGWRVEASSHSSAGADLFHVLHRNGSAAADAWVDFWGVKSTGQMRLNNYTATSSFPITAVGLLGFDASGNIGTTSGDADGSDDITGSGTANQFAYFTGTQSVTSSSGFTKSGNNMVIGPSGGDHVEIIPGTSEISFFDAGNVDARLKANVSVLETNVGMSITGNSTVTGTLDVSGAITTSAHFRAPGISSGNSGIGTTPSGTFNAFAPNGTSPYITFSEAGAANRGAFGFPTGSADFLWSVGNQVLSSGTEKMRLGSTGLKVTGTSSAAQLLLNNTTASTGKEWYINSGNAGNLFIGNPTAADVITINGTTGATTIAPALTLSTVTGTGTDILARTAAGVVTVATLGSGLSLSGGTLSAPGGATDLTFSGTSSPVTLNSNTGTDVTFTAGGINTMSASGTNLTITATEVDGSTTNEGSLTVGAGTGSTSIINSNTSGSTGVTLTAGSGIGISESGNVITLTATDASTTNELQTIANTSDGTSHTVTLSNSGGSVQLVEGSGITLTTTGTSGAGVVTIASSVGAESAISPAQLTSNTDDWAPSGISSATVVRLSTDAIRNITGILAPDAIRRLTLINIGTKTAMLTGEDASSTAANRFAFYPDEPLLPGATITIIYDLTSARWRKLETLAGYSMSNLQTTYSLTPVDATTLPYGWAKFSGGTGAGVSATYATSTVSRLFSCATGTTTTGSVQLRNADYYFYPSTSASVLCRADIVTPSALSDGTNTYTILVGIDDGGSTTTPNGFYFKYTHGTNSGKWLAVSRNSGTETTVDTGVTVAASTIYTLSMQSRIDGSRTFWINGAFVGETTANAYTNIAAQTANIVKSAGTTSRTLGLANALIVEIR